MSKLVQFTDAHFPGLTPNSCDNLNNMKLNLSVTTISVNFSANNQSLLASFSLQIKVITRFFQVFSSVYFKGH